MSGKAQDDVGCFLSTRGSLILAARGGDPARRREALDELLRLYLPALRAHLLYRRRIDLHRAEDLLQAFVTRKVLERELLTRFDPARGRFRSFLLKSLQNFVFDHLETNSNQIAMDRCEPLAESESPVFEVEWSRQLLQETLRRMRQDCVAEGKAARWELFHARVIVPTLTGGAEPSYRTLVDRFGFRSAEQACNALVTAKRQFERTLRALISETEHMLSDEEIDAEIADLCTSVRRAGPLDVNWDRKLIAGPQVHDVAFRNLDESNASELASLLDTTATREGNWRDRDLGELQQDCLAMAVGSYLGRPLIGGISPTFSADSPSEYAAVSMSLGELFRVVDAPLGLLIAVKRHARRMTKPGGSDLPAEVHRCIYFVSIAAAMVRHGERISKSNSDMLMAAFDQLAAKPWIEPWLRRLLGEGVRCLSDIKKP